MSRPVFWLLFTPAIVVGGFVAPLLWDFACDWSARRAVVS